MNCKHCNAELPEEVTLCPACGKEQTPEEETCAAAEETVAEEAAEAVSEEAAEEVTEEVTEAVSEEAAEEVTEEVTEAVSEEATGEAAEETAEATPAKASTKKITTSVIAIVLLAAVLIGLIAGSMGGTADVVEPTAAPAESVPEETVVIPFNGDPKSALCKQSYTVSDEEAVAAADVVVATMGSKELTNGELQAYYWQEIYMFLNEYGSYVSYLGLDVYTPFDQQLMMGGSETEDANISWQQFFLDGAIATWKNYQGLALEAEAEGYQLTAEEQEELATMEEELNTSAVLAGFQNADELVAENVGAACDLESYLNYVNTYYTGMSYYYDYCSKLDPTDAEVEAFYAENEDYFTENGMGKEDKHINIRHVLLMPEGGETGEDGYPVYTDEAWEACRVQAEELYNQWQQGDKSEDSFAQLAMDSSEDGSASNGGLYEDVAPGDMVEAFDAWCFDESRVPGDHGLVKTQYGYHIMFFSAHRTWFDYAREGLIDDIAYDKIPTSADKHPSEVDFSLVRLGEVSFY